MRYQQMTASERYTLAVLRKQGCSDAEVARVTGRHRNTIGRETSLLRFTSTWRSQDAAG